MLRRLEINSWTVDDDEALFDDAIFVCACSLACYSTPTTALL